MYGSMQGIVGGSLGQVKGLDRLGLDDGEEKNRTSDKEQKALFSEE